MAYYEVTISKLSLLKTTLKVSELWIYYYGNAYHPKKASQLQLLYGHQLGFYDVVVTWSIT